MCHPCYPRHTSFLGLSQLSHGRVELEFLILESGRSGRSNVSKASKFSPVSKASAASFGSRKLTGSRGDAATNKEDGKEVNGAPAKTLPLKSGKLVIQKSNPSESNCSTNFSNDKGGTTAVILNMNVRSREDFSGGSPSDEDGGGNVITGSVERSGVELFLINEEDRWFKATVVHEPYFFLVPKDRIAETGTYNDGSGAADEDQSDELDDGELRLRYGDLVAAAERRWGPWAACGRWCCVRRTSTRPTTWGGQPCPRGGGPCSI